MATAKRACMYMYTMTKTYAHTHRQTPPKYLVASRWAGFPQSTTTNWQQQNSCVRTQGCFCRCTCGGGSWSKPPAHDTAGSKP